MDPITAKLMSAAGAAAADPVYVDDVFATHVYQGNSSQNRTITNGIDLDGEGGLVWIKGRSVGESHRLQDTVNGITKSVNTDTANAETTDTQRVKSVSSTGFVIGDSGSVNDNNQKYCSWTFRKCPGFFDVVTYTGNSTGRNISHNLGSEPGSIWIKRLDDAESWIVYHRSLDPGGGSGTTAHFAKIELESTGTQYGGTLLWSSSGGGQDHTSTTFHVSSHGSVNANGGTFVAYIFAHDDQSFGENGNESIIKCGSYTGNSAGLSVDLGFEPQWLYIRSIDHTNCRGMLFDSMRGTFTNENDAYVRVNGDQTEIGSFDYIEFTSEGFGSRTSYPFTNGNNLNYIYIAIRRSHKPPENAADVFQPDLKSSNQTITTDFPVDLCVMQYTGGGAPYWVDRVRGIFTSGTDHVQKYLNSASSAAQGNDGGTLGVKDFDSTSYEHSLGNFEQSTFALKRAAGFFDIVAYTGDSSNNRSLSHNLNAVPEFMIGKRFSGSAKTWITYHKSFGYTKALELNNSTPQTDNIWAATPTSTSLTIDSNSAINTDGNDYIIYLFSTLAGISKVGSYTGSSGYNIDVDCGFTAGARFVMIKRTDSTGDWYYWHTALGINSGNDPYLRMNSTGSKVTNTDYIDPLNVGFTVTSSAPAALNASSGTYIFLAIA